MFLAILLKEVKEATKMIPIIVLVVMAILLFYYIILWLRLDSTFK